MLFPHAIRQNRLLAALPPDECMRLLPHLELVPMALGHVLSEPGVQMNYVYFPTTSIMSLLHLMENGASTEIAVVGHDGIVGTPLFMGDQTGHSFVIVQHAGHAYRLKWLMMTEAFTRPGEIWRLALRYTQALLTQAAQTAVCNRHHALEQQLCRCLLMTLDRLPANELVMTQEQLASRLGVRREGVTEAAGRLQKAGVIAYRRGHISVLDRAGLEARSCDCYAVVRKESERLLPDLAVAPSRFSSAAVRQPLSVGANRPTSDRLNLRSSQCQASCDAIAYSSVGR